jgi:hypothetical protein
MHVSEKWRQYYQDPFGFFDNIDLRFHGLNFNFFARSRTVARNMLIFSLVMGGLWALSGLDSSPGQLIHVLYQLPAFFQGHASLADLGQTYNYFYGKEMHYSAFVIYGLMFWALSVHMDQGLRYWWANLWGHADASSVDPGGLGISKSKNIVFATCLTLLAGGVFEFFWIYSFSFFQGQPWVGAFHGPQLRIISQNMIFVFVGGLGVFYMWADGYVIENEVNIRRRWRFNWSWASWVLICLTAGSIILWWFYPAPVQQITVTLTNGQIWRSSPFFPQTLYTIELTPGSGSGTWFYVTDDWIHGLNTFVKILLTLCFTWVGMLRKVEKNGKL